MPRRAAFTLVELLMVVLIVGILASVAIPTYAGQAASARDAEARQALEVALRAGRAVYARDDRFPAATEVASAACRARTPTSRPS